MSIGTQTDVNNFLSIVIGVVIYSFTQSIELVFISLKNLNFINFKFYN